MRWISEIQVFLLIILCFFGTAIQGEPEPQLGVPFPDGKTWIFVTFLGKLDLKEVPNWIDSFIWFCTFGDVNIFPKISVKLTIGLIYLNSREMAHKVF